MRVKNCPRVLDLRYEAPNVVRLADAYLKENNEKERLTYRIKQLEDKITVLQDINELNKSLIKDFEHYLGYKS